MSQPSADQIVLYRLSGRGREEYCRQRDGHAEYVSAKEAAELVSSGKAYVALSRAALLAHARRTVEILKGNV